ncbi:MAG: L-glutamate gamma-semialdehyde dehydrogenase [Cypionkella sp.]|nr:L-glutamate gamma-semialdehyde dehydrogenase [Cypionkella sp.]
MAREAGKTIPDAIAELREAVDFLRYYASQTSHLQNPARGVFTCISPWNFPLAIFTGQVAAALAAGNGVLAKPAETTPIMAHFACQLLHRAGVPQSALQLVLGDGPRVGAALVSDPRVSGVCFTGSTATAQRIARAMAAHLAPDAPLIAETGGLNAMIVDATALPEQAVRDIAASAFRSAGQRCSALRIVYVQADIAPALTHMLQGAMEQLRIGDPWAADCDIGPVITGQAAGDIAAYIDAAASEGRLLVQGNTPADGHFIAPALLRVSSIADIPREVFGPVLHLATFQADALDKVLADINARGYGLTFGLHSRITARAQQIGGAMNTGNIYINRNQIGAVVGSQPFGGEGLSGTGPKAGGPMYLPRFTQSARAFGAGYGGGMTAPAQQVQAALRALPAPARAPLHSAQMPGPTGEENRLSAHPRGAVLCLGPTPQDAAQQATMARARGCPALTVCAGGDVDGQLDLADLQHLQGFAAVALWADATALRAARRALSARDGALIPLVCAPAEMASACVVERHICTDTTAAGGNAALLSGQA